MQRLIASILPVLLSAQVMAQIAFSITEQTDRNTPVGWSDVQLPTGIPAITAANTFVITDAAYGASTASSDNTAAIQAALNAAAAAGGGMVVVPAGTFLSGYLTVGSRTVLHLCENATLQLLPISAFATDGNGYHKMDSPFITGKTGASDIVIEGESRTTSILDGQGAPWWDEVETAKAAKKSTSRQAMIRFWQGQRYLFRNFRVQNAPNTNITIGRSGTGAHTTAHDITIYNPASSAADPSHNTDGFPIWTQYVNIYDCDIDTGDDNVVCDQNAQYVHVWDCNFKAGHGASLGSYTTNMHDILYENLTFNGTDCGFRLKSNNDRSGDVYNITFRNCTLTNVLSPILITCWYDSLPAPAAMAANPAALTDLTPRFHDITIRDITVSGHTTYTSNGKNGYGIFVYGRPESFVRDITFDNVNITHSKGLKLNFCSGITFTNCSIAVQNTNQTAKNGVSTYDELPAKLIEQKYQGSYTWNGQTPAAKEVVSWLDGTTAAATIPVADAWTLTLTHSDASKKWTVGNGTITYDGTKYKTLKNSNGAPNTLTLAAGQKATRVDFYAVTNNENTPGKLTAFNGETCDDEVSALANYSNPTLISKTLTTPVNQVTFTFGVKQVCFIAVVYYEEGGTTAVETVTNRSSMHDKKILHNGQIIIVRDGKRYNLLGMEL